MQPPPTSEIILGNGFHDQGAKVMRMVLLCVQQVMKRHYSDRDVSSDVEGKFITVNRGIFMLRIFRVFFFPM